ncbi:hypothetical protein [Ferruginibacter profundus]
MTVEDKQIEEIIQGINYAISDIEHNRSRKISAFILCVCCIDTLGALCYNINANNERWEKFITNYMSNYKRLDLYNRCRNNIIHGYTSNEKYALSYDKTFIKPHAKVLNPDGSIKVIINVDFFIDELVRGVELMCTHLKTINSPIRDSAIERDKNEPILRSKTI